MSDLPNQRDDQRCLIYLHVISLGLAPRLLHRASEDGAPGQSTPMFWYDQSSNISGCAWGVLITIAS